MMKAAEDNNIHPDSIPSRWRILVIPIWKGSKAIKKKPRVVGMNPIIF
jgi:hypothetical protein